MNKNLKNWSMSLMAVTLLLGLTSPLFAALPLLLNGQPIPTLADIVEPIIPSIVNIATSTRIQLPEHPLLSDPFFQRFFDLPSQRRNREKEQKSLGSGVVVDAKKGLVLTNQHVINKADQITVTLRDGRSIEAQLVGVDKETDIAVIKIKAHNLTDLPLGNSDTLRVGDFVVAIGNPFGLGQTVTSGIVSALGRRGLGIKGYEDFIQTDASINPGNSGGALINLMGELVGINTAILARGGGNVGIGFAIPVNMAKQIMEQLIEYGEVRRGLLGIQSQDLTIELAEAFRIKKPEGAVVSQVVKGSAAHLAGLRQGDVVIKANGHKIHGAADLRNIVGLLRVGERVQLVFIREGKKQRVNAVVAAPKRDRIMGGKIDPRLKGAVLECFEDQDKHPGIILLSVKRGSVAWNTKLRPGDHILSVNRQMVNDFNALKQALRIQKHQMLLNILRGEEELLILVR